MSFGYGYGYGVAGQGLFLFFTKVGILEERDGKLTDDRVREKRVEGREPG